MAPPSSETWRELLRTCWKYSFWAATACFVAKEEKNKIKEPVDIKSSSLLFVSELGCGWDGKFPNRGSSPAEILLRLVRTHACAETPSPCQSTLSLYAETELSASVCGFSPKKLSQKHNVSVHFMAVFDGQWRVKVLFAASASSCEH